MRINFISGGSITINGKSYKGNNVSVINGVVVIDGKQQEGVVGHINNVTINGNCGEIANESGDITVAGYVNGDCSTGSGDIKTGEVKGSVRTGSGDVYHK